MGKLNQIVALVSAKKQAATKKLTDAYQLMQKPLFSGISRTYSPKEDDGDRLPPEKTQVQMRVGSLVSDVCKSLRESFNLVCTQDIANCEARANVVVDGVVVLEQIPVTHLLFLEKATVDLATFINSLPVLDTAEKWSYDAQADCYATEPSETVKTKKVAKPFVKYEATKEHPAQVDVVNDDIVQGYWKTVKFSGAINAKDRNAALERVTKLREAVVRAREEANSLDVSKYEHLDNGGKLLNFVFADLMK